MGNTANPATIGHATSLTSVRTAQSAERWAAFKLMESVLSSAAATASRTRAEFSKPSDLPDWTYAATVHTTASTAASSSALSEQPFPAVHAIATATTTVRSMAEPTTTVPSSADTATATTHCPVSTT